MSSRITPCRLCGYDAPVEPCPHCGLGPREPSLARAGAGPLLGLWTGIVAVPRGLWFLLTTRGIKRWLVPPLILTLTTLSLLLAWGWAALSGALGEAMPDDFELAPPSWDWLHDLSTRWEWLGATVSSIMTAINWVVNHAYGLLANRVSGLVVYFLLGILASWYVFAIAYEAFAGPFLDEIQARLETKWFGSDPRSNLHRPTDIPASRCFRLSMLALVPPCLALVAAALTPLPFWVGLLAIPACFAAAIAVDRRYGTWLGWIARVEGGAVIVSLKASAITFLILSVTWPLYFFPPIGYVLFAIICGFATAVTLLDIPCERRGWSTRQRLGFVKRHLLPFTAFGVIAGFLLAIPVLGALLMVPSASIGGLWLLCRLDKGHMAARPRSPAGPGVGSAPPGVR